MPNRQPPTASDPATPSPYRFLPAQRSKVNDRPKPAPPVPPHDQLTTKSSKVADTSKPQQPWTSNANQFAATPRFSVSGSKPPSTLQRSPSPQKPSLAQALARPKRPSDDVGEPPEQDEDDKLLELEREDAVPTIETNDDFLSPSTALPFSPKRRRLDSSDPSVSAQDTPFRRPFLSATSVPAPCFTSQQPPSHPDQPHRPRPAFIRPSPAAQEQNDPLPQTFSPHKRGQKFVPGGMAATLQQWVIETGEVAVQSRRGQGYLVGENWVTRVRVDEVVGALGAASVRGVRSDGDAMRMLLAGAEENVRVGAVLGIKAPVWEIEVHDLEWSVGVDWKVLP